MLCVAQEEAARNREQNLEEAKSIKILEDTSLPQAKKVNSTKTLQPSRKMNILDALCNNGFADENSRHGNSPW